MFFASSALLELWFSEGLLVRLIYPLDDTYIQMAIAKNLARDLTWGVAHQYANAGTSLAWPPLLALVYYFAGLSDWAPLVLNYVAAGFLLVIASRILERHVTKRFQLLVLLALVAALPMPFIARLGMEHTMACAVSLWALWTVAHACAEQKPSLWVPLAGAALMLTRYDLAAVVAPLTVVIGVRLGWRRAAIFAAAAALPVLVAAAVSWSHGWPLLPTSVLMKQRFATLAGSYRALLWLLSGWAFTMARTPTLMVLFGFSLGLALTRQGARTEDREARVMLAVAASATFLHAEFGQTGWLFRYESHLIAMAVVAIGVAEHQLRAAAKQVPILVAGVVLIVSAMPFAERTYAATFGTMGRFRHDSYAFQLADYVQHFPPPGGIALGNIGVVGYRTESPIVDVVGLLTPELLAPGREPDPAALRRAVDARGVRVSLLPVEGWMCVGSISFGETTERIFVADDDTAVRVARDMAAFARVRGTGLWLGDTGCQGPRVSALGVPN